MVNLDNNYSSQENLLADLDPFTCKLKSISFYLVKGFTIYSILRNLIQHYTSEYSKFVLSTHYIKCTVLSDVYSNSHSHIPPVSLSMLPAAISSVHTSERRQTVPDPKDVVAQDPRLRAVGHLGHSGDMWRGDNIR